MKTPSLKNKGIRFQIRREFSPCRYFLLIGVLTVFFCLRSYAGGPTATTPVAWFKANDLTSGPVSLWPDASGNGNNATQPTATKQPAFIPSSLINGKPAVRFDGVNDLLAFDRVVQDDFTIAVVFFSAGGVANGSQWYQVSGLVDAEVSGVTNDFGVSFTTDGRVLAGTGAPDVTVSSAPGLNSQAHAAIFRRTKSTGAIQLYVDGVLVNSKVAGTQTLNAPTRMVLGSLQPDTAPYPGDIAEVLVYASALSDAENVELQNYLAVKYRPDTLWAAGRNLLANEKPDGAAEGTATNTKVSEWSYGYRSAAASTALTLFTPQQHINDPSGLEGWVGPGQATLGVNTKGSSIIFNTGSGDYKPLLPQQIYLSPGSGNEFLVARWTAPEPGDYRVLARWVDLDNHGGNGAIAQLIKNGSEVFNCTDGKPCTFAQVFQSTSTKAGRAWMRARTMTLNAGDTLDFVLGSLGEHTFDATAFNATIRRVPRVTITSPASGVQTPAGQDVTFTVAVDHNQPLKHILLFFEDPSFGLGDPDTPNSITVALKPGYHKVVAVATDADGAEGVSEPIAVMVLPPSPAAQEKVAKNAQADARLAQAATVTPGYFYHSVRSGSWYDPGTWGSTNGGSTYPLTWDYATIQSGHEVFIPGGSGGHPFVELRGLTVNGRLFGTAVPPAQPRDTVRLFGTLHLDGQLDNLELFINGPAGKFLYLGEGIVKNVHIVNQSVMRVTANQFHGEGVTIENRGIIKAGPPRTSQGPLRVPLSSLSLTGGKAELGTNTIVEVLAGARINGGTVQFAPGWTPLIGNDGTTLIGNDGNTLIGMDGNTLIGNDGNTLIGMDSATLISDHGAALIGDAGSGLVSDHGLGLIGDAGSGLVGPDGLRLIGNDGATLISENGLGIISHDGGSLTGTGEIRGNLVNRGGFIIPGRSPGGIVVTGNYTQESGGSLVLELGGKTLIDDFRYDIFQVAGTANLGGNLVVKTIDGYTPASGDTVPALLYGSRTGNFASISSNAQVTFGAKGAEVTTNGTNPQGPRALNISTRLQIQGGDNALFAGFIVTGPAGSTKKVLIRGIGPSLAQFGVPGTIPDPLLELHGSGVPVINDDWQQAPNANEIPNGLAPGNSKESIIIATLSPGNYSAILKGAHGETGVGLAEVYDLQPNSSAQLANIATRGLVQTGDNVLIGGFIIAGNEPAKILVRAIGPSLSAFGLQGALQDTTLELHDSNGGAISNDNWAETDGAAIFGTTIPPSHPNEAAVLATLAPGNYTAVVRGADGTTGIAVVEAYNLQ